MGKVTSSNHLLCDLRQRGGDMTQFSSQREAQLWDIPSPVG